MWMGPSCGSAPLRPMTPQAGLARTGSSSTHRGGHSSAGSADTAATFVRGRAQDQSGSVFFSKQFEIDSLKLPRPGSEAEVGLYHLPSLSCHCLPRRWVGGEVHDGFCQRTGGASGHQSSGLSIGYDFRRPSNACGEDRDFHGQCLECGVGKSFGVRGKHHEVEVFKCRLRLTDIADEMHRPSQVQGANSLDKRLPLGSIADQHRRTGAASRRRNGQGLEEVCMSLLRTQPANSPDDGASQFVPEQSFKETPLPGPPIAFDSDCVVQDAHLVPRVPRRPRAPRRSGRKRRSPDRSAGRRACRAQ